MPKTNVISVDFQGKSVKFNPLQVWKERLSVELEAHNYSTSLPSRYFPDAPVPVDNSPDLYTLNTKVASLEPTKRIVLFRNFHFMLSFHQQTEETLLLETTALATGIDALLLVNKFQKERKIVEKHANYLLQIFLLEENDDE